MSAQKPTLSIFTGSKGLGTVFQEQNQIMVKYSELNVVGSTTTGRLSFNLFGKTRIIIIQGAHTGEGFDGATDNAKLKDFVYEIEQWVNTNIVPTIQYVDSLNNSYSVNAVDWSWVRSFDDPNRIIYTLLMKETAGA